VTRVLTESVIEYPGTVSIIWRGGLKSTNNEHSSTARCGAAVVCCQKEIFRVHEENFFFLDEDNRFQTFSQPMLIEAGLGISRTNADFK